MANEEALSMFTWAVQRGYGFKSNNPVFRLIANCCALAHWKPNTFTECNGVNIWLSGSPDPTNIKGTISESFQHGDEYLNFCYINTPFSSKESEEWICIKERLVRENSAWSPIKPIGNINLEQMSSYLFNYSGVYRFNAKYGQSHRIEVDSTFESEAFKLVPKGVYIMVNRDDTTEMSEKVLSNSKLLYSSPKFLNQNYYQYKNPYLQLSIVEFE